MLSPNGKRSERVGGGMRYLCDLPVHSCHTIYYCLLLAIALPAWVSVGKNVTYEDLRYFYPPSVGIGLRVNAPSVAWAGR